MLHAPDHPSRTPGLILGAATVAAVLATVAVAAPRLLPAAGSGSAGPTDAPIADEIRAAAPAIKQRFVRGMELGIDPRVIAITDVETLPNRSYIVYLAVPVGGSIRTAAVFGHCVEPHELGDAGGFVTGRDDLELAAQREAASSPCPTPDSL